MRVDISVTVTDVNETPTLISLSNSAVPENTDTSSGHSVGSLTTTDEDSGDSASYSIVGGADSAVFNIGGAGSDELILSDGVLDHEAQASYEVTVRVTDGDLNTYDQTFTVTVSDGAGTTATSTVSLTINPVNDEQVLSVNTGTTVNEASTGSRPTSSGIRPYLSRSSGSMISSTS